MSSSVVLVGSGAFAPVHRNHLRFFEAVRRYFSLPTAPPNSVRGAGSEREVFPKNVLAMIVSPLPDRMISRSRTTHCPRSDRVEMLRRAAVEVEGLQVVHEERHGKALLSWVREEWSRKTREKFTIIAMTGSDGVAASESFLPIEVPLASVRRTGYDEEWNALWKNTEDNGRRKFLVEENLQPVAFSATEARTLLQALRLGRVDRSVLDPWMPSSVLEYALKRELFAEKKAR